jgi:hypothetical protein
MRADAWSRGAVARTQPATVPADVRAQDAARIERELERARSAAGNLEGVTVARPALVVPQPPQVPAPPAPPPADVRTTDLPGGTQIQSGPNGTTITRPDGRQTIIRNEPGGGARIVTPDGREIRVGPEGVVATPRAGEAATGYAPRDEIPPQVVPMVGTIFGTVAATIIFFPIARAWARRMDRKAVPPSPELTNRLDRIEQAVEAIAVEVERVSEAQRYSARLLTERLPDVPALRAPAQAERV